MTVRRVFDVQFRISDFGCRTCLLDVLVAKEVETLRSGGCQMSDVELVETGISVLDTYPGCLALSDW